MEQFEDKKEKAEHREADLTSMRFDEVLRIMREVPKQLQDGGPPVDYAAVLLWLNRELPPEQRKAVSSRIATWKPWYEAFREISVDLAACEIMEQNDLVADPGVDHDV